MATTLTTTLTLLLEAVAQQEGVDLSTPEDRLSLDKSDRLADGISTDQADVLWHDTRTLAATSEDLDLAGSLTDGMGNTVTFAAVKGILIHNTNTTAGETLTLGGAASSAFASIFGDSSDKLVIRPDGLALLWAPRVGYTVTAGTGDKLKVDAGAATIIYDILIVGTSA
jgi:hypothetical protein